MSEQSVNAGAPAAVSQHVAASAAMPRWRAAIENLLSGGARGLDAPSAVQVRIRSLNGAMILTMAVAAPFAGHYGALGLSHMAWVLLACVGLCLANMWLIRRTHLVELCGYVACFTLYLPLLVSNITSGGFYQPNFAWLYIVPLVGAIVANVRVAVVMTLVVLLTAVAFWVLPPLGIELTSVVPVGERATQALANRLSAIFAVGALTWLFARQQQQAESALRRIHSELEEESERVAELAFFDGLTGLPNRRCFREHLSVALRDSAAGVDTIALLFFDIDRFKDINDTLGHSAGDKLLKVVGQRLIAALQSQELAAYHQPDHAAHMVSRLGGDEFIVLLHGANSEAAVAQVTQHLLSVLREPFLLENEEVFVSASVGVAFAPNHGERVEELLMCADTAMYAAKHSGGDAMMFFADNMGDGHRRRLVMGSRLRRALDNHEGLSLVYQPIIDSDTMKITSVEALLRWTRRDGSRTSPAEFIPVAEAVGLAPRLDTWVLSRALRDLNSLQLGGSRDISMAVNISAQHMRDPQLVDTVFELLSAIDIMPHSLELEITESALITADNMVRANLERLRQRGIGIALDDFGTGYSSLSHVRKFPVTKLKIDRSFVMSAAEKEADAMVCGAIATLGEGLGLAVVAEGIETDAQRELFTSLGCSHLQGYLFSRPLPLAELTAHLDAGGVRPRQHTGISGPGISGPGVSAAPRLRLVE